MGCVDGNVDDLSKTKVPIFDRGLLYGDSIYEVLRTYSGIPFLFDEHYKRLLNSARLSKMAITQTKKEIITDIKKTVLAAQTKQKEDVYIRYQITRGEGSIDLNPKSSEKTRLIIIVKGASKWNSTYYDKGVRLAVVNQQRNTPESLDPNIKGGNYLNNIIALSQATSAGSDDCLMLDRSGYITECSNSNIWFVISNKVVTPSEGILYGITRKTLIPLLEQANIKVQAKKIKLKEVAKASGCFITSATREIMPVSLIVTPSGETLKFPLGGDDTTKKAQIIYKNMISRYIAKHPEQKWF